ncbi:MAG: amidohydrolase family protein [Bryobacteraceae bacterium]
MRNRFVCTLLALASVAAAETVAIVNANIVPVASATIPRGSLLIQEGKITAVGARITVPRDARKIEGAGLSVYPGLINAFTDVGLTEIASVRGSVDTVELGPFNPQAQAWIAVNPHSEMVRTSRVNGITSALVAPSGGRISGAASVVNLFGFYPDQMALSPRVGLVIEVPSEAGRGRRGGGRGEESSRRTPAEELALLKEYLREAKAYAEMRARGGAGAPFDLPLESMIPVIRGQAPALCHASGFREIRTAVELGDEFGLKVIIVGGAEAWKVVDLLKQKNIPVIYDAIERLPRAREDPYDINFSTPETLRRAGVRFAIATGGAGAARNLPYHAALASAYGLEREDALRSISQWPAEILGIADKVGSIATGKLANLLVTKGDPLDVRSEVVHVFIEGREVPLDSRNSELYDRFSH